MPCGFWRWRQTGRGRDLGVTVNRSAQETQDPSASQILSQRAKSREGNKKREKTNKRLTPYTSITQTNIPSTVGPPWL